jgi:hypothetical protein
MTDVKLVSSRQRLKAKHEELRKLLPNVHLMKDACVMRVIMMNRRPFHFYSRIAGEVFFAEVEATNAYEARYEGWSRFEAHCAEVLCEFATLMADKDHLTFGQRTAARRAQKKKEGEFWYRTACELSINGGWRETTATSAEEALAYFRTLDPPGARPGIDTPTMYQMQVSVDGLCWEHCNVVPRSKGGIAKEPVTIAEVQLPLL